MRFSAVASALYLLSDTIFLLAAATPLYPQLGALQLSRRRAVDYVPVEVVEARKLRRRAINYSVVPVDGSSSVPLSDATTTIVETILTTPTALSSTPITSDPATITGLSKSGPTVTIAQETVVVTESESLAPVKTSVITHVTTDVISSLSTSVSYYDNGLWHTSYPIRPMSTPTYWQSTSTSSLSVWTPTSTPSSTPYAWDGEDGGSYTSSWAA